MIDHDQANTARFRSDRLALEASDLESGVFRMVVTPQVHQRKTGNQWQADWDDFVANQLRARQCQCWDQCAHCPSHHA
jgi:hypothetical protein